jgi:hypothetical protein
MSPSRPRSGRSTPAPTFSADELVAALEAAAGNARTANGLTTQELCAATGLSQRVVQERLGVLHRAGRLLSQRIMRVAIDGAYRPVSAYRLNG